MEEFEFLVVWNDEKYITSFGYVKENIAKEDLIELDRFLQYHGLRYTTYRTHPTDIGVIPRIESVREIRMSVLDIVK